MSLEDKIKSTLVPLSVIQSKWDYQRWLLRMPTLAEVEAAPQESLYYYNNWDKFVDDFPDQGNRGTCVAFCNGLDQQINEYWENGVKTELSEEDLYWKARNYDGLPDWLGEGSNNLGAMKARQKEGVCLLETRPYNSTQITKTTEEYIEESCSHVVDSYYQIPLLPSSWKTSIAGIISDPQWDGPKPVVAAYKVTQTMLDYAKEHDGIMPPDPGVDVIGGHSSLFGDYGLIDGEEHLFNWNSWGDDAGDRGFFKFPMNYLFNGIILEGWISHNGEPINPNPDPEEESGCSVAAGFTGIYNGLNSLRGGRTRLKAVVPK